MVKIDNEITPIKQGLAVMLSLAANVFTGVGWVSVDALLLVISFIGGKARMKKVVFVND